MECPFSYRKCYDDYFCTASNRSVSFYEYNNTCTTTMYLDCGIYKRNCYVSSMIFDLMGVSQNDEKRCLMGHLRKYVSENEKIKFMVEQYDDFGPKLADVIKDLGDNDYILSLYFDRINPICDDLSNNNYNQALIKYFRMIRILLKKYSESVDLSSSSVTKDDLNNFKVFRKSFSCNNNKK